MNMALTSSYLSHFISEIRKTIASPTSKGHFGNGIRELLKHFFLTENHLTNMKYLHLTCLLIPCGYTVSKHHLGLETSRVCYTLLFPQL